MFFSWFFAASGSGAAPEPSNLRYKRAFMKRQVGFILAFLINKSCGEKLYPSRVKLPWSDLIWGSWIESMTFADISGETSSQVVPVISFHTQTYTLSAYVNTTAVSPNIRTGKNCKGNCWQPVFPHPCRLSETRGWQRKQDYVHILLSVVVQPNRQKSVPAFAHRLCLSVGL